MQPNQRREANKIPRDRPKKKRVKKKNKPWGIRLIWQEGAMWAGQKHHDWFLTEKRREQSVSTLHTGQYYNLDNKFLKYYRVKREGKKIIIEGEIKKEDDAAPCGPPSINAQSDLD